MTGCISFRNSVFDKVFLCEFCVLSEGVSHGYEVVCIVHHPVALVAAQRIVGVVRLSTDYAVVIVELDDFRKVGISIMSTSSIEVSISTGLY